MRNLFSQMESTEEGESAERDVFEVREANLKGPDARGSEDPLSKSLANLDNVLQVQQSAESFNVLSIFEYVHV